MRKKIIPLIMAAGCAGILGGCSGLGGNTTETLQETDTTSVDTAGSDKENIKIVTTIFPEYDWVKEITGGGEGTDITLLCDNGTDMHSYQPSVEDVIKISESDVFIYVGGESDEWVENALKDIHSDVTVINLFDVLGENVKEEELTEGMQADEKESGEEETEYDEHVWLSLSNAKIFCREIADTLSGVNKEKADTYSKNAESYIEKLTTLDDNYRQAVGSGDTKTLVFGDRFPFRYLTDDYGIDVFAAFPGCSAETEASFETITFLSGKVDELGLKSIMTIDGSDKRIAETIRDNTKDKDQEILTLDSMQAVTEGDLGAGKTYLSSMESNLEVLKEALKK